jgi:hypothetical protein
MKYVGFMQIYLVLIGGLHYFWQTKIIIKQREEVSGGHQRIVWITMHRRNELNPS